MLNEAFKIMVHKMKNVPNAIKFGTQNRSNMLIINITCGNSDHDPKLNTTFFNFYKTWYSEQIEHANHK